MTETSQPLVCTMAASSTSSCAALAFATAASVASCTSAPAAAGAAGAVVAGGGDDRRSSALDVDVVVDYPRIRSCAGADRVLCCEDKESEHAFAKDFLAYMHKSPSPFHAVESAVHMLHAAGYVALDESTESDWKTLVPGGRYYVQRNQSTLVAFAVGGKYERRGGFSIIGAHTDSPVLKLKPVSKISSAGCLQLAVEPYGGGLWYTWFDRSLSVAGRVIYCCKDSGKLISALVRIDRPLVCIPSLAIHLNRELDAAGFNPNKQSHLVPVLASAVKAELLEGKATSAASDHHPLLLRLLADELKIDASSIRDFELNLFDMQPACISGALNEFIMGRALDNLCMSYVALRALVDSSPSLPTEENVRVVALFDHEEVGSVSACGAASSLMPSLLRRIHGALSSSSAARTGVDDSFDAAISKSLLVSADMAHALHPNYMDKHEPGHRPMIHKGLVVKWNVNQRYATTAISSLFVTEVARRHGLPLQKFVSRSDMPCGSTVGPMLSSGVGIRTVDVGIAQWAMHSIRETCGISDLLSSCTLLKHLFAEFPQLDKSVMAKVTHTSPVL